MWTQLTSADLDRAKQELNTRRTETLSRHAIELENLQTEHAEELNNLSEKQANLERLGTLIESFTREFNSDPKHSTPDIETTSAEEGTVITNDEHETPSDTIMLDEERRARAEAQSVEALTAALLAQYGPRRSRAK